MSGKLFLLPTYLDADHLDVLPDAAKQKALSLKYLIVENVRTTRRYLKILDKNVDIDAITFFEWDKRNPQKDVQRFLKPARDGHDTGILSEAGCPGIADPGQAVVLEAHRQGIAVVPMVGPSSILLALMASGLSGQQFRFHGYLPIDDSRRNAHIRYMEKDAAKRNETQVFMETPYRNNPLIRSLLLQLAPGTRLCIAANLTGEGEFICTKTVAEWKKEVPDLHKQPAIFLIL